MIVFLFEVEQEKHNRPAVVPHVGIPFKPIVGAQKRCTVVKPFSFEERNKKLISHKEERIRKIVEAEKKVSLFIIVYSGVEVKIFKQF
jgi:hypothetical protein